MAKSDKSKDELEMEAVETAAEGLEDLADAADTLEAAEDVADVAKVAGAAGVSDLTRAMDAEVVADRLADFEPGRGRGRGGRYGRRGGNDSGL